MSANRATRESQLVVCVGGQVRALVIKLETARERELKVKMNVRHAVHSLFKSAAEAVLPPLNKSQFAEKGVLTPEEFVAAGDYLTRACPTWSW